jgi:transcriptional regulator with XRE-family HTH domain
MPRTPPANQNDVFLGMLREVRVKAGVTQVALAEQLGFRQTDVSKAERGVRRLDVLELRNWMRVLGMPFREFADQLDERLASLEALQRQAVVGRTRGAPRNS